MNILKMVIQYLIKKKKQKTKQNKTNTKKGKSFLKFELKA